MSDDNDYEPFAQTKRFDIFHVHVTRNPGLGCGRDVYMAWFRDVDQPRSACEVTLFGNYVEWLHVCETLRRTGIATEVIEALETKLGQLGMDGVTDSGTAFIKAIDARQVAKATGATP